MALPDQAVIRSVLTARYPRHCVAVGADASQHTLSRAVNSKEDRKHKNAGAPRGNDGDGTRQALRKLDLRSPERRRQRTGDLWNHRPCRRARAANRAAMKYRLQRWHQPPTACPSAHAGSHDDLSRRDQAYRTKHRQQPGQHKHRKPRARKNHSGDPSQFQARANSLLCQQKLAKPI